MDDVAAVPTATPPRRRLAPIGLVAGGLVAGVVLAGVTAAGAQSGNPTPSVSAAPGERPPKADRMHRFGKHGGPGAMGLGKGVLHGEFTVRDPDGDGFRTMATQNGEATAVSATSITVRSEDGFSRTYAVGDDTLVNAGDEGIADISTGDRVHVLAVVSGGDASAVRVIDVTTVERLREQWRPGRAKPTAAPSEG